MLTTSDLNDAELQDLIESEAIALTEDAIFLAKREIYREFANLPDETIRSIANDLVDDAIDSVMKDIYYPDHFR